MEHYQNMAKVTVQPERIVSLSPSSTEILFAVGAGPKIVGVTDYCNYPPELDAKIEAEMTKIIIATKKDKLKMLLFLISLSNIFFHIDNNSNKLIINILHSRTFFSTW